jgi:hypothetical protein
MVATAEVAAGVACHLPAPAPIFKRSLPHFRHQGWNRGPVSIVSRLIIMCEVREGALGIDSESDTAANLVIGPTSLGMVRIYVESEGIELPMDFEPEEALEIADELRAAAEKAMAAAAAPKPGGKPGQGGKGARGRSGGRRG